MENLRVANMGDILKKMLETAKQAYENAYVPNSHFAVGAVLLTEDDNLYAGANVENACYAMSQCAEAAAIGNMVAKQGASHIKKVLVIADAKIPIVPCGGCLQKLSEFSTKDTEIHCYTLSGEHKQYALSDLQPVFFRS